MPLLLILATPFDPISAEAVTFYVNNKYKKVLSNKKYTYIYEKGRNNTNKKTYACLQLHEDCIHPGIA